jgi:hypothetical protein
VRGEPGYPHTERELFDRVRQLVTWHYQWLVVHDYLKTVTQTGVVDKILLGGNKIFTKRNGEVYMPLEFSVAAYRFGHTMVRAFYDYNRNFGRDDPADPGNNPPLQAFATFKQLFDFTGSAVDENGQPRPFSGFSDTTLPRNWVIEWNRFVDKGAVRPDHFARRIDTQLAPPLFEMLNQTPAPTDPAAPPISDVVRALLRALAVRNLLRGYSLSLPTGQAVADALGVPALDEDELHSGNTASFNAILDAGGFQTTTPLWYYVLKEAEVREGGERLGPVAGRIVAEVLAAVVDGDPTSFRAADPGWTPSLPAAGPSFGLGDLLAFADTVDSG